VTNHCIVVATATTTTEFSLSIIARYCFNLFIDDISDIEFVVFVRFTQKLATGNEL